jgi:hypothetical protein
MEVRVYRELRRKDEHEGGGGALGLGQSRQVTK